MDNIKNKAVSGMAWTALQRYSVMLVTFISDIILARLLTPYDYGCIEMLAIFVFVSETFINGGFGSALIQKKNPTQDDYSTIFYWNLGMAVILYLILFLLAPTISVFYKIPELCSILRIQGLILFVYAFNLVQLSLLKKELRFKELSVITIISSVVSLAATIGLAYSGYGVWSLVAKNLIAASLTSLICWFYIKWRPKFVFSWKSFKELFSFGFFLFLSNLITTLSTKLQGLLIGRFYTPSVLGYYGKASGIESLTSTSISQVMDQVTYPLYTEVQDDKKALQNMVKRLTTTLSYLTFPLMFVLMLIAKPLIVILYSDKWLPCVPYFQILCLAGIGTCLQSVNFQTIAAIGKSKITFKWTFIKRSAGIGLIVGGLVVWGMKGLLCGTVINAWFAYFVNMGLVSRHIGYKWYQQLKDLAPVSLVSVLSAIVCYFLVSSFSFNIYIDGLIKLILYVLIYAFWSFVFKPEAFIYSKDIVEPLVSKIVKRHKY